MLTWSISGITGVISILFGIYSLSSIWTKDEPQDPYRGAKQYIQRFECCGLNSQQHYEDLKGLDVFYSESMEEYCSQIENRAALLRLINIFLLLSVICLVITFSILFFSQLGGQLQI